MATGTIHRDPVIAKGTTDSFTIPTESYVDINVDFGITFPGVPNVQGCFVSNSTSGDFGLCSIAIKWDADASQPAITRTGCTFRCFNGGSNRIPRIAWLAIY